MVQIWRICSVFFCFLACSLHSITQKSIEHRIARNCGAFAPYFFGFLACLCPKPNEELCCCSLPANVGLLMIHTPEFIRICSLTYETQGEVFLVRGWSKLHPYAAYRSVHKLCLLLELFHLGLLYPALCCFG